MIPINKPQTRDVLLHVAANSGIIQGTEKRQGRASDSSSTMRPTHKDGDRSMRQPEDDSSRISAENQAKPPKRPKRIDFEPTYISEEDYAAFVEWYETTDQRQVREVMCDFAGAEYESLVAVLEMYLYPQRVFAEPWWIEMSAQNGGSYWVDDYDIETAILDDYELWVTCSRIQQQLERLDEPSGDLGGVQGRSRKAAGRMFQLADRWLAVLKRAEIPEDRSLQWWFRLDWETIIRWWKGSLKRIEKRFEPDGYVYLLGGQGYYKIGKARDVGKRLDQLVIQLPWKVSIEHTIPCEDYSKAERHLHEIFSDKRANGEWFNLDDSDLKIIKGIKRMQGDRIE